MPGEFNLFFREVHGAEENSARLWRFGIFPRCNLGWRFRFALWRLVFRFWSRTPGFVAALVLFARLAAGFVTPGFITARAAGRLLLLRRLFAARRLDAAERAPQFVNLAFIGKLLAFGDLDEFKHFVQMVNHLLERRGHFCGVLDSLTDGRGFSGAEIGGLDPRFGPLRFRAAFGPAIFRVTPARLVTRRFGCVGRFYRSRCFRCRFGIVGFHGFRFVGSKISRHIRMRLAEITSGFSFLFRVVGVIHRLVGRGVGIS